MKLKDIIGERAIDMSPSPISVEEIEEFEALLEVKTGPQLREYLTDYGYIGYQNIEMFGINSKIGARSSMIRVTRIVHETFPKTIGMIALEDICDGEFYLIDSNDRMYRYIDYKDELTDIDLSLFSYIEKRLNDVDNML